MRDGDPDLKERTSPLPKCECFYTVEQSSVSISKQNAYKSILSHENLSITNNPCNLLASKAY